MICARHICFMVLSVCRSVSSAVLASFCFSSFLLFFLLSYFLFFCLRFLFPWATPANSIHRHTDMGGEAELDKHMARLSSSSVFFSRHLVSMHHPAPPCMSSASILVRVLAICHAKYIHASIRCLSSSAISYTHALAILRSYHASAPSCRPRHGQHSWSALCCCLEDVMVRFITCSHFSWLMPAVCNSAIPFYLVPGSWFLRPPTPPLPPCPHLPKPCWIRTSYIYETTFLCIHNTRSNHVRIATLV